MKYESCNYRTLEKLKEKMSELNIDFPLSNNTGVLKNPLEIGRRSIKNRLAIQPMEGCDGESDGSPGEYTLRRYKRFSKSGAGLIWLEAAAVAPEGRTGPRQLMLTEKNLGNFKALADDIRETALKTTGVVPVLILQLTHSGRYSKPGGKPAPIIAYHNAEMESTHPVVSETVAEDSYLDTIPERYYAAAALAEKAGFDGGDVKACHGYLFNELLSAYGRPGRYGGCFENRIKLLVNSITAAKSAVSGGFLTTARINVYDGLNHPYGFGVVPGRGKEFIETEGIELLKVLNSGGMELINITMGNPYYNPHVNRPSDRGLYEFPEHPLAGIARMCNGIGTLKKAVPQMKIIASSFSYLRQYGANQAAGMVEAGFSDMAGFGRQAFAYPEFARDILEKGALDPSKCCVTCAFCTRLMRAGSVAGCVIRDTEVYTPLFKSAVLGK